MQPSAPTAYLTQPTKPYCAISRDCSRWEVQNYRNEVDRYYSRLRDYARDVDDFYDEASRYVECMSDLD